MNIYTQHCINLSYNHGTIPYTTHIYTPHPHPHTGEGARTREEKKEGSEKPLSLFHACGERRCPSSTGMIVEYWVWGEYLAYTPPEKSPVQI